MSNNRQTAGAALGAGCARRNEGSDGLPSSRPPSCSCSRSSYPRLPIWMIPPPLIGTGSWPANPPSSARYPRPVPERDFSARPTSHRRQVSLQRDQEIADTGNLFDKILSGCIIPAVNRVTVPGGRSCLILLREGKDGALQQQRLFLVPAACPRGRLIGSEPKHWLV